MMMLMRIEDEDEGEDKDEDDDEPAQCGGRSTVSKMLCIFQLCPCSGGRAGLPWLLLPSADSHLFLCSLKLCSFFTAALCPTLARSRQGLHFTYSISERHCRLGRALRQSSNFYQASTKMFLFPIKALFPPTPRRCLVLFFRSVCGLPWPEQRRISQLQDKYKKIDATEICVLISRSILQQEMPFVPFSCAGCGWEHPQTPVQAQGAVAVLRAWFVPCV